LAKPVQNEKSHASVPLNQEFSSLDTKCVEFANEKIMMQAWGGAV
jgi:hypothetical protein